MSTCASKIEVEKLQCTNPTCKPRPAGKVFPRRGCVKDCMIFAVHGPDFDNHVQTPEYVPNITHGVSSHVSQPVEELVSPEKKSTFQQKLLDNKEFIYESKVYPLQKCRRPIAYEGGDFIPDNKMLFGETTEYSEPLGKLVNPSKSYEQVMKENAVGHENYVVSHHDYNVGEMVNRKYDWGGRNPKTIRFGRKTPYYSNGKNMENSLNWVNFKSPNRYTHLVSSQLDSYKEKFQPQMGKVLDPMVDTRKIDSDYTFGAVICPDEYGAGDLIHMRDADNFTGRKDMQRGWLACIRHHLKMANYHNFDGLEMAFKFYDENNTGYIDAQNLRDACWKFNLPIDDKQLRILMQCCCSANEKAKEDNDLKIDYVQFVNFLNWQKKYDSLMPPNNPRPENDEKKEKKIVLLKQIDRAIGNHFTTNTVYDHTLPYKASLNIRKTNGIPTVRTDLPAPRIRRLSDRVNYGDESDAFGLIHPSVFSTHGVYDRDFFQPRSRDEIRSIFEAIGVKMSDETFEKIWNLAVEWSHSQLTKNKKNQVCVEAFRSILDSVQGAAIHKEEKKA